MSRMCFRANLHSIVAGMLRKSLLETGAISEISDSNGTRTLNHLVCKRTLDHLVKVARRLSCVVSIYLYGASDRTLLSCHVRVLGGIYNL